MHMSVLCVLLLSLSLVFTAVAKLELTAQYFQVAGRSQPSIKLCWFDDLNSEESNYIIVRKLDAGEYMIIAALAGNTYDDYEVPIGQLTYQVIVESDQLRSSHEVKISSKSPSGSQKFLSLDNTQPSALRTISRIKLGQTYYSYSIQSDNHSLAHLVERTSSDGYNFSNPTRIVLSRDTICAGSPTGYCKLEAVTFVQNKKNSEVLMWAHWESSEGYAAARVAVAFGQPGGKWTFGGSFRPLGCDSRDLSFFQDDDGSGYLISATSMNTNMNIYKLNSDWHNVTKLVTTVLKGLRREAPSMIKQDGFYYLFTSQASGWYPSVGQYISSTNLSGPWSESRNVGNLGGFAAQSGGVAKLGSTYVMCANQWSGSWKDPEPPNRQVISPISLSNGWANYYFYESLRYLDDDQEGGVYGVQSGQIILADAGNYGNTSTRGLSAINLDPKNIFRPPKVPFTYVVDLGHSCNLTQFDLTTNLIGGSETAYRFTICGADSPTGPWKVIADKSNNTRVGFVTGRMSGVHRYVKLKVNKVFNVINRNDANWAAGIYQFTVYGQSSPNTWENQMRPIL